MDRSGRNDGVHYVHVVAVKKATVVQEADGAGEGAGGGGNRVSSC